MKKLILIFMLNTNKTNLNLEKINLNQKNLESKEIIIGSILIIGLYFVLKKKIDDQNLQNPQKLDDQNLQNLQNPQKLDDQNLQDSQKPDDQILTDLKTYLEDCFKEIENNKKKIEQKTYFKDFLLENKEKEFFFKIDDLSTKQEFFFKIKIDVFKNFIDEFFNFFYLEKDECFFKKEFKNNVYFFEYLNRTIQKYKNKIFFTINVKNFEMKRLFKDNLFREKNIKNYLYISSFLNKDIFENFLKKNKKECNFGFEIYSKGEENESEFIEKLLEECIEKDLSETERVF